MSANKCLRRLLRRIDELKMQIDFMKDEAAETEYYTNQRAYEQEQAAHREYQRLQDENRRIEERAQAREWERGRIARDLQRAVDWKHITGRDSFGDIERNIQKLRRL